MTTDRSLKKITDVLSIACHVPICDVCVLHHNNNSFKAYVHGTTWYGQHVYNVIVNTWNIDEKNILIEPSTNAWQTFGSNGYVIEVKY